MPSAIAIRPPRSHPSQRLRQSLTIGECSRSRRADRTEGSAPGNRSTDFLHNWICTVGGSLQQRCGSSPSYGRVLGAGGSPRCMGRTDGTAVGVTSTCGEAACDRSGRGARRSPCTGQRPHRANVPRTRGREPLARIDRDEEGVASRLFPFVRGTEGEPKVILMDPKLSFGKPVIVETGIPVSVIVADTGRGRIRARSLATTASRRTT